MEPATQERNTQVDILDIKMRPDDAPDPMVPSSPDPAAATPDAPMPQLPSPAPADAMLLSPLMKLPTPRPRPGIDFSIVEQIDGLLSCLYGLRIMRDVCAVDDADAVCQTRGLPAYACLGEDVGLYFTCPTQLPTVLAVAASHRACGVFVIPADCGEDAEAACFTYDAKVKKRRVRHTTKWRTYVSKATVFEFRLPRDAFTPPAQCDVSALLVSFACKNVRLKRRRPKLAARGFLQLHCQPLPAERRTRPLLLEALPVLRHRVSPLAEEQSPTPQDDVAPRAPMWPPVSPADGCAHELVQPIESAWKSQAFEREGADYPDPQVLGLALQTMRGTSNPFRGDLRKPVALPARHDPATFLQQRTKLLSEVSKSFTAGPFSTPPFPNARVVNTFTVPKDKYRGSEERRLVHHYSQSVEHPRWRSSRCDSERHGGRAVPGSINALCYSPHFLTAHLSVRLLCDRIALCGHGASVTYADVPKAFKLNPSNPDLLALNVTQLAGPDGDVEYFVERCNTFGWMPSEWGWQAELAIILWCLAKRGVADVAAYVDNFYCVHPPGSDVARRSAAFFQHMQELGVPLHEDGVGFRFKALGWELDLDCVDHPRGWRMVMVCPGEKRAYYRDHFAGWVASSHMTVQQLESAVGMAQYMSEGFPEGAAHVAPLLELLRKADAWETRSGKRCAPIRVTDRARESLVYFVDVLLTWDGTCPITAGFGPTAPAERHGWVDAATTESHGCGGVYWDEGACELLGFSRPWTAEERALAQCELRESTGVLEAFAVLAWLKLFGPRCELRRTLLRTDNEAVMLAVAKAFSDSDALLTALRDIRTAIGQHHMRLRVRQVNGKAFNEIADHLSHQRIEEAVCLARQIFGVELRVLEVDASAAVPEDLRARRN